MSNLYNDQILDAFMDHTGDCQQYNSNNNGDMPLIKDCICEEVEKKEYKIVQKYLCIECANLYSSDEGFSCPRCGSIMKKKV